MTPIPIQRSRKKKYPECGHTLTVTRPGIFGNPYMITKAPGGVGYRIMSFRTMRPEIMKDVETEKQAAELAVLWFREFLADYKIVQPAIYAAMIQEVRKADYIACWCPLDMPCHRDVWIELAQEQP